jgi:hypothetical protein
LETGLTQISNEAQNVVKKNIWYKKENEALKTKIEGLKASQNSELGKEAQSHEQAKLMQSQHLKNQNMIEQLKETVSA